jgi:hypothetical protein
LAPRADRRCAKCHQGRESPGERSRSVAGSLPDGLSPTGAAVVDRPSDRRTFSAEVSVGSRGCGILGTWRGPRLRSCMPSTATRMRLSAPHDSTLEQRDLQPPEYSRHRDGDRAARGVQDRDSLAGHATRASIAHGTTHAGGCARKQVVRESARRRAGRGRRCRRSGGAASTWHALRSGGCARA